MDFQINKLTNNYNGGQIKMRNNKIIITILGLFILILGIWILTQTSFNLPGAIFLIVGIGLIALGLHKKTQKENSDETKTSGHE